MTNTAPLWITSFFYERKAPRKQDVIAQAMSIFPAKWASRDVDDPPRQSGMWTHRAEVDRPADTPAVRPVSGHEEDTHLPSSPPPIPFSYALNLLLNVMSWHYVFCSSCVQNYCSLDCTWSLVGAVALELFFFFAGGGLT